MALTLNYLDTGKGITVDGSVLFDIYGKMFDPNVPDMPDYNTVSAHNASSSFDVSGFQPGNEVCMCILEVYNVSGVTISGNVKCVLQQRKGGSRYTSDSSAVNFGYVDINDGEGWTWYMWVGIDPDEIRPGITQYRFKWSVCGEDFYRTFTISNLSFDSNPHPAGYLWVEGGNLCYVPPSIYSGSSSTGYKHMIQPDPGYSGSSGEKPGYIWIPTSSSDHHIYYVNQYGIVSRTKESYDWSGGSSNVGSSKKGFIRLTPSTSSRPEQAGYNYLCYVDGGGYKRRMGVGEI